MAKSLPTTRASVEPPMPTQADKDREMTYRAEEALRDMERAKKHESDKELMKRVKSMAKQKIKDLGKIC